MAQTFLEAGQDRFVVAAFEIDDPIRLQACLGECRREEVRARHAPQHLALRSGGDAGGEQGRGRTVDRTVPTAGDLVQRTERQAAARESRVDVGKSEGQHRCGAPVPAFNASNLGAQGLDGGLGPHSGLLTSADGSTIMFLICSL